MTAVRTSRPAAVFGSPRFLAVGVSAIVAVGITTGVVAELLTVDRVSAEAAIGVEPSPAQQRDIETKQSLVSISHAVEAYYVTGSGPLTLEQGADEAVLKRDGTLVASVKLADGTAVQSFSAADYSTWCLDATNTQGTGRTFSMSSGAGLLDTSCASASATALG